MIKKVIMLAACYALANVTASAQSINQDDTSPNEINAGRIGCCHRGGDWRKDRLKHHENGHHGRRVLFVDATTTSSLEEQNGSREMPFATVSQAVDHIVKQEGKNHAPFKIVVKNAAADSQEAVQIIEVRCKAKKPHFSKDISAKKFQ